MPMNMANFGSGAGLLAIAMILWGIAATVFWMVCAWRAMRAHEKLADSVEQVARTFRAVNRDRSMDR